MLTHAPPPSLRRLRQVLDPLVAAAAATPGADRYRKRFTTEAHLWTLLVHTLLGNQSVRQTHALVGAQPAWWQAWGMDRWIHLSQLARSSTSRPLAPFIQLYQQVHTAVTGSGPGTSTNPLDVLQVLDSTFLPLSGRRSAWARAGRHEPGIRLQTQLVLGTEQGSDPDLVMALQMTGANRNDAQTLAAWDLRALTDTTLLLDLGYYGHRNLSRLREAGVHFILPLHPQATVTVTGTYPLPADPWLSEERRIRADHLVTIGSDNNRRGAVLPQLRLITLTTPEGDQHYLTDRHDLTAPEIVAFYQRRWRIELFFRWIKHQLGVLRPIGTSPQAVWITLLLAAIVTLLLALVHDAKPTGMSTIVWLVTLGFQLLLAPDPPGG